MCRNGIISLFLLLFVYCPLVNTAQQPPYQFSQLDITKGLSHNRITSIYKDHKGFMWFGTIAGLNRYDGYSFKTFTYDADDSLSLADSYVQKIFELPHRKMFIQSRSGNSIYDPVKENFTDAAIWLRSAGLPAGSIKSIAKTGKYFWFLFADSGLYKMYADGKTAKRPGDNNTASAIADVKPDSKGNLVIVYRNGVIEKMDCNTDKIFFSTDAVTKELDKAIYDFSIFTDMQDDIWLYLPTVPFGAIYYNTFSNEVKKITKENGILNNNIVSGIVQDANNNIWIGTDHGGANVIDKKTFRALYIKNIEGDNTSLSQNVITTLYKDDLGFIWLGTYKRGINYYHENITKFPLYRHQPGNSASLGYDDVNRFVEDSKGNIWIGTNGGGLIYFDRQANTFKQYRHEVNNSNSISNDVIVSLCIDHENKLWIGSYFGGLDCFDGARFIHYRHSDANSKSLAEDRVWEIYEDGDMNLWIGTYDGGLDRFDRENNIFYHYKKGKNSVSSNYAGAFAEDADGNLWIGTDAGLDVLQKASGKFLHYNTSNSNLSNNDIISLLKDNAQNIWIGTRNGLNVFSVANKKFYSFGVKNGLPDNSILNILQDDANNIWISTFRGLSKISAQNAGGVIKINCKNYDELDGLQNRDFNDNAAYKTRSGELIFGGASGFNIFNPSNIKENKNVPKIAFTDFQLYNNSLSDGEVFNKHVILPQAISETKEITLRYNENVFSIEFASLSFDNTEKNQYAFMLEDFNKDWLVTSAATRHATYTNLDPGEYVFKVKAANDDGVWNSEGISMRIHILPPFWQTPLAYAIYLLVAAAILFFARRLVIQRARMRFALEQERKEAQRLHELDMMKIKFFTNVSHEFRTPLSLILTPLDKIVKSTHEPEQKKHFQLIHRNARRLLNLVNQLLDFRKMEVQELTMAYSEGDVAKFIRDICYSFTDMAEKKNIQFFYTSCKENLLTSFDHDKLERILFNLLSNAFKFTPENGTVNVDVFTKENGEEATVIIKIKDTGIGISKEKQDKIFERFFQSETPGAIINQGSGIGLAITKEFVRMHNGTIHVESELEKGTCFTVTLPFKKITEPVLDIPVMQINGKEKINGHSVPAPETGFDIKAVKHKNGKSKKQTILIVEDNEDFRFYLKDNLRALYSVIESANGKDGWQKTLSSYPDLIVTDISMPLMDGIELCKKIKADPRTKHIPVVILTALTGEDKHLKGLEIGATDYIIKPFNFEIMLSRIRNILDQQKSLKKALVKHVEAKSSEIKAESADEKFIKHAMEIIEKNLSNPDFSVEELSRELYVSRVAIYKRVFNLTGKSPLDFIRSIRLQHAAQLLEKTNLTVSEVAYEVGFNNPKYFAKFFKGEFNIVPSAYQSEKKKETAAAEDDSKQQ